MCCWILTNQCVVGYLWKVGDCDISSLPRLKITDIYTFYCFEIVELFKKGYILLLSVFVVNCRNMATRRSSRKRKAPPHLQETEKQQKRTEVVTLEAKQMEELVKKVADSVLVSLQSAGNQVSNNNHDIVPVVEESDSRAVDAVQGSVSAVLESISGELPVVPLVRDNVNDKPGSVFVSSSIPLGTRVPAKIKAKILANEYVDFGSLLTNSINDNKGYHLCFNEASKDSTSGLSTITLEPKVKNKFIQNIDVWTSAFQVFVAIYTEKFSSEAPGLMKYGDTIRDLASRGFNWRFYDESFRYLRQGDPQTFPWGSIHSELWIRSQPPLHHKINSRQNMYNINRPVIPDGYCRRYHRGAHCSGCNYSHVCPKCKKNHALNKCNFRDSNENKQTTLTTSSTNNTSRGR